jgi:hypothetical protein
MCVDSLEKKFSEGIKSGNPLYIQYVLESEKTRKIENNL